MTPVVRDEEAAGSDPGHPDSVKHQVRGSRREASLVVHPALQRRKSAKVSKDGARTVGVTSGVRACNVERGRCLLLAQDSLDQILSS